MNADDLAKRPDAGSALLFLHRWLQRNGIGDKSAFDLFGTMLTLQGMPSEADAYLAMLVGDAERADATALGLKVMHDLDRMEAIAKSLGIPLVLPPEAAARLAQMRRDLDAKGGKE